MAYLNPNDIPVKFFTEIVNKDLENLRDVFNLIEKYSMITLCNGIASIHRLVRSVKRLVLQDAGKQNLVLKQALSLVTNHTDNQLIAQDASVWNYVNEDCELVIEFRIIPAQFICALSETLRYEEASAFGKVSLHRSNRKSEITMKQHCLPSFNWPIRNPNSANMPMH